MQYLVGLNDLCAVFCNQTLPVETDFHPHKVAVDPSYWPQRTNWILPNNYKTQISLVAENQLLGPSK